MAGWRVGGLAGEWLAGKTFGFELDPAVVSLVKNTVPQVGWLAGWLLAGWLVNGWLAGWRVGWRMAGW